MAIVTGASRGIGRAIAQRLAHDGFTVVVNCAGNAVKADEVVAEITSVGGQAMAVQADIASAADVERLFQTMPWLPVPWRPSCFSATRVQTNRDAGQGRAAGAVGPTR